MPRYPATLEAAAWGVNAGARMLPNRASTQGVALAIMLQVVTAACLTYHSIRQHR
jgi:hypothetical protein